MWGFQRSAAVMPIRLCCSHFTDGKIVPQAKWLHHSHHWITCRSRTISGICLEIELLCIRYSQIPQLNQAPLYDQRLSFPVSLFNIYQSVIKSKFIFTLDFITLVISEIEQLFRHLFLFFSRKVSDYTLCPFFSISLPLEFLRTFINKEMFFLSFATNSYTSSVFAF